MSFDKLVVITGKPGLFEIKTEKNNGVIVKSLLNGKSNFISINTHAFSLLSNISIYTQTDAEPIAEVMKKMKEMEEAGTPLVEPSSSKEDLRAYFTKVLPEHDESQVYPSDIKKLVKWYNLLKEKDRLDFEIPKEEAEDSEDSSDASE